jgi:hypothetical protein
MSIRYFCCHDQRRRAAVAAQPGLNGLDFLEVLDGDAIPDADRQRILFVHFIKDPTGVVLGKQNVRIRGGERDDYRDPAVDWVHIGIDTRSGGDVPVLVVKVARPGDFSTYTLELLAEDSDRHALDAIDPKFRSVDFSFKAACAADFDCLQSRACPAQVDSTPSIDYLARDYDALRRWMLDRLSTLMPEWKERNAADLGVALVELLAYVGDHLAYRQDAIATEAYLGTARRRVSVRRHARLVDYPVHDGCNARAWVQVQVEAPLRLPRGTPFLTAVADLPGRLVPGSAEHRRALGAGTEVFESMQDASLYPSLNRLECYTWGARECCLPKGSTSATLLGRLTDLKPGMVLIFQEAGNPRSGFAADADLRHRHAVKLEEVLIDDPVSGDPLVDPVGNRLAGRPDTAPLYITEITWARDDALPFPLCISAEADDGRALDALGVALGNVVLADHGRTVAGEDLGTVPKREPALQRLLANPPDAEDDASGAACARRAVESVPVRFRPAPSEAPLTQAVPLAPGEPASARAVMAFAPGQALPQIILNGGLWKARRDLLNSGDQREFVVETENDGSARLRFGDGCYGAAATPGTRFVADYRVGNGSRGNVGADTLVHVVSDDSGIRAVGNPMPARGGTEPEAIERAREHAPQAFRGQRRAVTPADYAATAGHHEGVQKAVARRRWTGSWHTVFVSADRVDGTPLDAAFEEALRGLLEPYRLAGHDLEIDRPRMVPLELALRVDVADHYERSRVRDALLEVFSNHTLADGRRGVFHPDNFSFGQSVYLSPLYAAAQAVDGVEAVDVLTFQRQGAPGRDGIDEGRLTMGRFEIAHLDNDPNFPGRGSFRLELRGGR